jgi:hypothetical protein
LSKLEHNTETEKRQRKLRVTDAYELEIGAQTQWGSPSDKYHIAVRGNPYQLGAFLEQHKSDPAVKVMRSFIVILSPMRIIPKCYRIFILNSSNTLRFDWESLLLRPHPIRIILAPSHHYISHKLPFLPSNFTNMLCSE